MAQTILVPKKTFIWGIVPILFVFLKKLDFFSYLTMVSLPPTSPRSSPHILPFGYIPLSAPELR